MNSSGEPFILKNRYFLVCGSRASFRVRWDAKLNQSSHRGLFHPRSPLNKSRRGIVEQARMDLRLFEGNILFFLVDTHFFNS
jgi:hypothetical protein